MKFHRRLYLWLSYILDRMALFVLWIADGAMERPMTRRRRRRPLTRCGSIRHRPLRHGRFSTLIPYDR